MKSIVKNFDSMIKYEQYLKLADEYQCDMGKADWVPPFYPHYTNIRKMPDEMKVIILTNHIIKEGLYQQLQKELYRLRLKIGKRRIKESTLYEKAIDNII